MKKRGWFVKNSIAFVVVVVSICCLLVILGSVLKLPDISLIRSEATRPYRKFKSLRVSSNEEKIGRFGEMMIGMLPEDLAFTVFVPSEKAFERDLRLQVNASLAAEKRTDTYAVVSRILGFSAAPYSVTSGSVPDGKLISFDSISGFVLYISKDLDGALVVNRIRSTVGDIKRGDIVVHIVDGVLMDAEFEQAVRPDDTE